MCIVFCILLEVACDLTSDTRFGRALYQVKACSPIKQANANISATFPSLQNCTNDRVQY